MQKFEVPIFELTIELYKTLHMSRGKVPKQDRFTIWQKCENKVINIIESLLLASQMPKNQKLPQLDNASKELNILRVLIRLTKEVRTIDNKKYTQIEKIINEIGRMLGGWIKSTKL